MMDGLPSCQRVQDMMSRPPLRRRQEEYMIGILRAGEREEEHVMSRPRTSRREGGPNEE